MINKIATKNSVQKVVRNMVENSDYKNAINTKLPIFESLVATSSYSIAIASNNKIEKDRKPAMHWQNIISGGTGILLGAKINKMIQGAQDKICKHVGLRNIDKVNNVINGIKVAVPLIVFSTLLRFVVPVIATPISTMLTKNKKDKK